MDFTTGAPNEEALSQLIESLVMYIAREGLTASGTEAEAVSGRETEAKVSTERF